MTVATFIRAAVPAALALALTLGAGLAQAHPGHADPSAHQMAFVQAVVHLLTEPDHLALLAAAVVGGAWVVRRVVQNKRAGRAR
jgi:hydrogenase/urease accessory protein HupE